MTETLFWSESASSSPHIFACFAPICFRFLVRAQRLVADQQQAFAMHRSHSVQAELGCVLDGLECFAPLALPQAATCWPCAMCLLTWSCRA